MSRQCPKGCKCGSKVVDTRETGITILRRRKCRKCGAKWTTWERSESAFEMNCIHSRMERMQVELEAFRRSVDEFIRTSQEFRELRTQSNAIELPAASLVNAKCELGANSTA